MRIIGLDISLTDTGISLLDTDKNKQETDDFFTQEYGTDDYGKQDYILHFVSEWIGDGKDTVIFLEDYAFSRTLGKAFTRAELAGMIKREARVRGVTVFLVKPNVLKKWVTGSGGTGRAKKGEPKAKKGAAKAAMKQCVYSRWGYLSDNDNRVDAYALARYGKAFLLDGEKLDVTRINPIRKKG